MIGVCEALLYGYRAGLDLERVLQSVGTGAAGCWSLSNYGPADHRRQLRARLLRRALHQGHGHRARRSASGCSCALPGPGAGASSSTSRSRRGVGPERDALAGARARVAVGRRLGEPRLARDQQRQIDSPGIRRSRRRPQRLHILGMTPAVARSARKRPPTPWPTERGTRPTLSCPSYRHRRAVGFSALVSVLEGVRAAGRMSP